MSETRYDWLADRWVIFAPHRSQRPDEFVMTSSPSSAMSKPCPFCMGQESQTPSEVLVLPRRSVARQPWLVRVVPNKYPALEPLPEFFDRSKFDNVTEVPESLSYASPTSDRGNVATIEIAKTSVLFDRRKLQGAHEVIIESPEHLNSLTELSESHALLVFEAFRKRLIHWRAHDSLHYSVVFKNMGPEAGASLSHTHSQLIATNFVPPDVQRSCQRQQEYLDTHQRGYFEDMIAQELAAKERIILQSPNFVAVVPFASQIPYFVWVLPRVRQARFEEVNDRILAEFTTIVRRMLRALETLFPNVAYNFVLHSSPFSPCWDQVFHWRMEIFPRLTKVAGFEWGSDCYINPVLPEFAAKELAKWT
jgi:UDPglucose--hexose-1-phosphate uridylyltransferase